MLNKLRERLFGTETTNTNVKELELFREEIKKDIQEKLAIVEINYFMLNDYIKLLSEIIPKKYKHKYSI